MRLFTEHPATVGETYLQHMRSAFSFAATMILTGLACFIHGLFPFLFRTNGRDAIELLHRRMVTHRHRDHYRDLRESPASPSRPGA
jgi:hypothetical protein